MVTQGDKTNAERGTSREEKLKKRNVIFARHKIPGLWGRKKKTTIQSDKRKNRPQEIKKSVSQSLHGKKPSKSNLSRRGKKREGVDRALEQTA